MSWDRVSERALKASDAPRQVTTGRSEIRWLTAVCTVAALAALAPVAWGAAPQPVYSILIAVSAALWLLGRRFFRAVRRRDRYPHASSRVRVGCIFVRSGTISIADWEESDRSVCIDVQGGSEWTVWGDVVCNGRMSYLSVLELVRGEPESERVWRQAGEVVVDSGLLAVFDAGRTEARRIDGRRPRDADELARAAASSPHGVLCLDAGSSASWGIVLLPPFGDDAFCVERATERGCTCGIRVVLVPS